jgi:thioredoxin 1
MEAKMANLSEINGSNFEAEVLKQSGMVLVDFWAPWCGPCRMQTPILERLVQDGGISARIMKVNTDEAPDLAQKLGISSIPTLILFRDGKEIDRMVGVQSEESLKRKLS